jgi:SAM-dependent methyltransferase
MNIEEVRQLLKRKFEGPDVLEALRFRLEVHLEDPTRDPLSAQVWAAYLELPSLLKEPFTLLDAGCMSGFLYHHLKRYFNDFTYVGMDRWPQALQIGKEYAPGVKFIEADFTQDSIGEFDYIVLSNIPWKSKEHYQTAIDNLLPQVKRSLIVMPPNSSMVIFERTPGSTGGA